MFLITEDEQGLVSTTMHEAAGGLEPPISRESALSMLEERKREKKSEIILGAKSPAVAFQKWKGTLRPKICVMTSGSTRVQLNFTFTVS